MFLLFIVQQVLASSVINTVFKDISGHWNGILIHSPPNCDPTNILNVNLSVEVNHLEGEDHLTVDVKNISEDTSDSLFFIKKHPELENHVLISDRYDDDIAELFVDNIYEDHYFIARGLLKSTNDQITLSIEDSTISISISDQFSENYTLIQFTQDYRNAKINEYVRLGLIGSVIVALLIGLYKISDLTDIIPKDEGANALAIKQMAMAQERRKQMNEKKGKSKAKNE